MDYEQMEIDITLESDRDLKREYAGDCQVRTGADYGVSAPDQGKEPP